GRGLPIPWMTEWEIKSAGSWNPVPLAGRGEWST
ncbi:hypothetical protein AZZ94_002680, partial [Enterobacter hormaechei]